MTQSPPDHRESLTAQPPPATARYGILALVLLAQTALVCSPLNRLQTDPDGYIALGTQLAEGNGICNPRTLQPTAFRPPLLPFVLSAGISCGLSPQAAAAIVNILAALALTAATWLLSCRMGLNRFWSATATLIASFDPLLLRYSTQPMTEVLSAALLTIALVFAYDLLFVSNNDSKSDSSASVSRWKSAVWTGLMFGLCFLCRPVAAVTCCLVVCFGICVHLKNSRQSSQSSDVSECFGLTASTAGIVVLAALVVTSPWLIRNRVQLGKWIPATTHGGYTLLLGNNSVFYRDVVEQPGQPVWTGNSQQTWESELHSRMFADGITRGDEVAIDAWMYQEAFNEIRSQPGLFIRACWLRWKRFWSVAPTFSDSELHSTVRFAISSWYVVMWAGLAASLLLSPIRRRQSVQLLWIAILSFLLLHTFYWTNTRMRAPLAGVLSLLSASGWQGILSWAGVLRARGWKAD